MNDKTEKSNSNSNFSGQSSIPSCGDELRNELYKLDQLNAGESLVIEELGNDEYHSNGWLSKSKIGAFLRSPSYFFKRYISKTIQPYTSDQLALGSLVHSCFECVGGFEEWAEQHTTVDQALCTQAGAISKRKLDEARELAGDNTPISPKDFAIVRSIWESAQSNTEIVDIINGTIDREVSGFHVTKDGHQIQARYDGRHFDGFLFDWKTTREVKPLETFYHSVLEYRYDLQEAFYRLIFSECSLIDPDTPMKFILLSTQGEYECQVVTLPQVIVDRARDEIQPALDDIARRLSSDDWLPEGYGATNELWFPAAMTTSFIMEE